MGGFRVTLFKTVQRTRAKTRVETGVETKVKTSDLILDLIKANPSISREEIAKVLNLTIDGID